MKGGIRADICRGRRLDGPRRRPAGLCGIAIGPDTISNAAIGRVGEGIRPRSSVGTVVYEHGKRGRVAALAASARPRARKGVDVLRGHDGRPPRPRLDAPSGSAIVRLSKPARRESGNDGSGWLGSPAGWQSSSPSCRRVFGGITTVECRSSFPATEMVRSCGRFGITQTMSSTSSDARIRTDIGAGLAASGEATGGTAAARECLAIREAPVGEGLRGHAASVPGTPSGNTTSSSVISIPAALNFSSTVGCS